MSTNEWNAKHYAEKAGFVARLGEGVLEWLAVRPGERILDLGCGEGALTDMIREAGAVVLGVDEAPSMVEAACRRGLQVLRGDMHTLALSEQFDAVFTNAVLHWTRDIDAVVNGVRQHLRPGGRFVGEFGGFGNVAALTVAVQAAVQLRGQSRSAFAWYFPTVEEFCEVLERQGFTIHRCELIARPTRLEAGIGAWLETFALPFVKHLPEAERQAVFATATELLEGVLRDSKGIWFADYWRLRFHASLRAGVHD